MKDRTELEFNDNWETGSECPDSSNYCCKMHPEVEKFVRKGDRFPKCDQKNLPHNTTWHKVLG